MNYKVGQILYLCNEEKIKIIPLQVVEEIVKTTIQGKETNYILTFPDNKKTKINLNSIKGKLFEDIDSIKNHMISNATDAINRMSFAALELEKIAFDIKHKEIKIVNQNKNDVQVEANDDIIMVDLGDGVKAKINSSTLEKVANQ